MRIFFLTIIQLQLVFAQDTIPVALNRIYSEYINMESNKDVQTLVNLDSQLRQIFKLPWDCDSNSAIVNVKYYKSEYSDIGIAPSQWWPGLHYRGKLLSEAHRINPNSSYRDYTFYSTANCDEESCNMPNIDSVNAYIKQYPDGPFIFDTYRTLAEFYDDLYKMIRHIMAKDVLEYKYDCYSQFISKEPLEEQLKRAQSSGIFYYQKAIQKKPLVRKLKEYCENLQNGTTSGWFFCAD